MTSRPQASAGPVIGGSLKDTAHSYRPFAGEVSYTPLHGTRTRTETPFSTTDARMAALFLPVPSHPTLAHPSSFTPVVTVPGIKNKEDVPGLTNIHSLSMTVCLLHW